ncbi:MAG: cyclic 2,3-diphosphoglycerate synthase [Rhodocyclaceae bacterium]
MGAAGRDFHNFNVVFRGDAGCEVIAFTAAQIEGIAGRRYPASLAGALYPEGIPIFPEAQLPELVKRRRVDCVVFAYSDVPHLEVMHAASTALAAGADFTLLGPRRTMIDACVPVIAVSAVRTGCGKSQLTRWLARRLRARGVRFVIVRHPMPYGDLERQAVQRFAHRADLDAAGCTLEEREEYEPHLEEGNVVFAGADYARIAERAAAEAELILWDGGNNDFPFLRPDLHLVLADALRPGDEMRHHPGEAVLRMADIVIVARSDCASREDVARLTESVHAINPGARLVPGASPVKLDDPAAVRGRRVLVVEDGPSLTHGGMPHGAGYRAAKLAGASEIVDPRPWAAREIAEVFRRYPGIGPVLPALGYSAAQLDALARTIDAVDADLVVAATPADLAALLAPRKRIVRVRYEFAEPGEPVLERALDDFLRARSPA